MVEQKLGSFEVLKTFTLREGVVYQAYVTSERIVAVKTGTPLEGGKAFKTPGEKPMELQLQKKEHVAAAISALEPVLQGRLQKDPGIKV
jgi:hypothetical protein